jgi:hypothetical protein
VWDLYSIEEAVIVAEWSEPDALVTVGNEPDYGSGPYLALMARSVRLARLDVANPVYSADARAWLRSDIVALFADCIGFRGAFDV